MTEMGAARVGGVFTKDGRAFATMNGEGAGADVSGLVQEAAAWVVRLSGDHVSETEWLAFVAWLDDTPSERPDLRRQAFDQAQTVWLSLDQLRESAPEPRRSRLHPTLRRRSNIVGLASAAAAACVAVSGAWIASRSHPADLAHPSALLAYATPAGQSRTLRLADGSRIDMGGATRLTVDLRSEDRTVSLTAGEAQFDVVHDPERPFEVDLGHARVRVLGTAFDIVREGATAQVAVSRGAVSFQAGEQSVTLPAGRAARLGAGGVLELAQVSPADVGAWRAGRRVYWNRPVSEVLADMNRQYPQPIRLAGPQAKRMRFTGVLVLGTRDQTVGRLTTLLPLEAKPGQDGEIVLSARRP